MKRTFFLKISLVALICFPNIFSLEISKLCLESARVMNEASEPCSLEAVFHRKCSGCPRLHEKYTKNFEILAGEELEVVDLPNRINSIRVKNSSDGASLFCNYKNRNGLLGSFTIEKTVSTSLFFPKSDEFEKMVETDSEYRFVQNGHKNYKTSIPADTDYNQFFKKLGEIYKKNCPQELLAAEKKQNKIPKLIHTIWIGQAQMPDLYRQWLKLWQQMHPGWELVIWNHGKIKEEFKGNLVNQKIYDEALEMYDYVTMSKIARYEILDRKGGLYIDPDIKCFESFEKFHSLYDFYAGLGSFRSYGACNNAVIGARPGHPVLKAAITEIGKYETKPGELYAWTAQNLGHKLFTKAVFEQIDKAGNCDLVFPKSVFGPIDQLIENDFCHLMPIYDATYTHISYAEEAFCSRGSYSTISEVRQK